MKIISQKQQIAAMENIAAFNGSSDYDEIRGLMFDHFNGEFGRDKWTPDRLDEKHILAFQAWLAECDE